MEIDWDEPLVPRANAITRACACGDDAARGGRRLRRRAAIDEDPGLLLRWRGREERAEPEQPAPVPALVSADAWRGGELPPAPDAARAAGGAVLKRLGRSGVEVGDTDLVDVLERAYATFSPAPLFGLRSRGDD